MFSTTDDLSAFHRTNTPLFLISADWFNKWKKYCYFHHLIHDHSDKKKEMEANTNEIIDNFTSDEEEDTKTPDNKHSHPGLIDQSNLLEEDQDILLDPDDVFGFSNEVLKAGKEENKDFLIVNERVWTYLSSFYSGKSIKRYSINVNDKDYFMVEIFLKKVQI